MTSRKVRKLIEQINILNCECIDNSNINSECLGKSNLHLNSKGCSRLAMNFKSTYGVFSVKDEPSRNFGESGSKASNLNPGTLPFIPQAMKILIKDVCTIEDPQSPRYNDNSS